VIELTTFLFLQFYQKSYLLAVFYCPIQSVIQAFYEYLCDNFMRALKNFIIRHLMEIFLEFGNAVAATAGATPIHASCVASLVSI